MRNKVKVSIIVPVYNAGEYFVRCLDSLVNQTLRDIEIILVLDCPTDESDRIAKIYAQKDDRIIIVENSHNMHIGLSRNEGLKVASGEYVGFSDHDDYRELTMYEELYEEAKKTDADIVVSGRATEIDTIRNDIFYPDVQDSPEELRERLLGMLIGRGYEGNEWFHFIRNGSLWNKIYRLKLLQKYDIIFQDNRKITFEDLNFLIESFYYANRISMINKSFYVHVEEIENASLSYFYYSYPLVLAHLHWLNDFLQRHQLKEQTMLRFRNAIVDVTFNALLNEWRNHRTVKEKWIAFTTLRKEVIVRDAFRNISQYYGTSSFISRAKKHIVTLLFK